MSARAARRARRGEPEHMIPNEDARMNTLIWLVLLLVLGLVTGKVVGALTAFTRGPAIYDLLAGGLGALAGGVLVRSAGPLSVQGPLLTLLTGVGAAFLASWLTRIVTWPPEPPLRRPDDASPFPGSQQQPHDVMTTGEATAMLLTHPHRQYDLMTRGEGSKLLLREGQLLAAESTAAESQPTPTLTRRS